MARGDFPQLAGNSARYNVPLLSSLALWKTLQMKVYPTSPCCHIWVDDVTDSIEEHFTQIKVSNPRTDRKNDHRTDHKADHMG